MGIKIIAKNKRANYDYQILEKFETGIVLQGTEVKAIRSGRVTIAEAHVSIDSKGELWLYNMNIPHYEFGNIHNHEEARRRKLLMSRKDIDSIKLKTQQAGATIVPIAIYFKRHLIKIEIALGKGKKHYDKRESEKEKTINNKLQRGIYD